MLLFLEASRTPRDHVWACWLAPALVIFWSAYFFAVGDHTVHCGMFSGISDLYLLDAHNTLLAVTSKNMFRVTKYPLGKKRCPAETTVICTPQFYPNPELYPIAVALSWGLGYILTGKLHIQRSFKGAQACLWVC